MNFFSFYLILFILFTFNWHTVTAYYNYLENVELPKNLDLNVYQECWLFDKDIKIDNMKYNYKKNVILGDGKWNSKWKTYDQGSLYVYFKNTTIPCEFAKDKIKSVKLYENNKPAKRVCVLNGCITSKCENKNNISFEMETESGCKFKQDVIKILFHY
ncbi:hypothetical protein BCR32DRAFT_327244 [Anaeromyces robustus]|uniref:Uncharacterized protein n=1 Tax=Anaeromyces robustus TaxID=1754192 RepID=A0A1Y1X754_9FUNG|nr:hypothetical protein BCR32DRAFT_327244 [Anaeromyces robustus]|eukprot:ORX81600.1 hypothetical protein BCR32DRAFT_327244 [Anaeromyces robustus]